MRMRHMTRQLGFSLVELMVALLLGVILTSGVISVFVTSKTTYNVNNALGQVQEGGRFALTTLQPILAMAGYAGCPRIRPYNMADFRNILNGGDTDPVYMLQYGVMGYEYKGTGPNKSFTDATGKPVVAAAASEWSPTVSNELFTILKANKIVKNSDILIVHEVQSNPTAVDSDLSSTGSAVPLLYATTNALPMVAGELAVAANCANSATAFQITGWVSGSITHANPGGANPGNVQTITLFNPTGDVWPVSYVEPGSTVGLENTYVFFIGEDQQVATDYGLFELAMGPAGNAAGVLPATAVEIVPGVENMQLLYGIDTNTAAPPNAVDQLPTLFETADLITADTSNTASLGGGPPPPPGTPPDGVWNEVVAVRVALIVHSDDNAIEASYKNNAGTTLNNVVSQKFYMMGVNATDSLTYNTYADRRLRRYFAETFSVRSVLP